MKFDTRHWRVMPLLPIVSPVLAREELMEAEEPVVVAAAKEDPGEVAKAEHGSHQPRKSVTAAKASRICRCHVTRRLRL